MTSQCIFNIFRLPLLRFNKRAEKSIYDPRNI